MIQYYSRFFTLAFLLLLFQVLVFDNVDLFGFSDPAIYLVILITYRLTLDQFGFIFLGFATGFLLDLLTQTAGAHHCLPEYCLYAPTYFTLCFGS